MHCAVNHNTHFIVLNHNTQFIMFIICLQCIFIVTVNYFLKFFNLWEN